MADADDEIDPDIAVKEVEVTTERNVDVYGDYTVNASAQSIEIGRRKIINHICS